MKAKHFLITLGLSLILFSSYAQDWDALSDLSFKDAQDCRNYDDEALIATNFILNAPLEVNSSDMDHVNAWLFMFKWMITTADYHFMLDDTYSKMMKPNENLVGVVLASMVRTVMENNDKNLSEWDIKLLYVNLFLDYCTNPANGVKLKKDLKKMVQARDENRLEEYLKSSE